MMVLLLVLVGRVRVLRVVVWVVVYSSRLVSR